MATPSETNGTNPLRLGIVLFPGFEALDAFGPLEVFNTLSLTHNVTQAILATTLDPVSTKAPGFPNSIEQRIVPTHTFANAPPLDILLVPGGLGTRGDSTEVQTAIAFIRDAFPGLQYLMTVCTGSGLAARAGVLDGLRATTNKRAWADTTALRPDVQWVARARWVVDGKAWTSSGVSAGIDVALAWVEEVLGSEVARNVMRRMEYTRHTDAAVDPFAELYGLA
ncbi:hypothetical protein NUU61_009922 [Penicillium alfredii]|uniref:DJ-1/PfpI domain-containing protein n=1 Tax=Penicillium alfredii TaxID=1506179 RepID=A0A9W9JTZ4_9EURO|nr:uncharacterized protein NUU61_009922 [Penicillium alfredii]KAJ5081658.1 hypothetical protein NUU61_009922 [Penicillium alfredii]